MNNTLKFILLTFFTLLFCACSKYNITVYFSPDLKEEYGYYPSLELDIVGVNESEKRWLENYKIDTYFEVDNPLRKSLEPYTIHFSSNKEPEQLFSEHEKQWKAWNKKGFTELIVLVNLPGLDDNARKIMKSIKPTDIKSYFLRKTHYYIELRPTGLTFIDSKPSYDK